MDRTPIPGCSKGSRGLSVFLRVLGIFTETAISPSPSLRQRSSRYAIRAGRNLPDKEFRYLRHCCYSPAMPTRLGRFGSASLSTSPRRSDHIFAVASGVQRMASEDSVEN